jgi:hypothetical protein
VCANVDLSTRFTCPSSGGGRPMESLSPEDGAALLDSLTVDSCIGSGSNGAVLGVFRKGEPFALKVRAASARKRPVPRYLAQSCR